jgi:AcrR family transcriptional regulator
VARTARPAPVDPAPPAQPAGPPSASVPERILRTASDLFYEEGIRAVGIQRVIEEAGIAKASLYAHYASKDDLVAACLDERATASRARIEARLADPSLDARGRLLRFFEVQAEAIDDPAFRGCPLINANSEISDPAHPAKAVTARQRAWLHRLLASLATEAGAQAPDDLAGALLLIHDGAAASALVDRSPDASRHARRAAEQLLDAHLPIKRRRSAQRRRGAGAQK